MPGARVRLAPEDALSRIESGVGQHVSNLRLNCDQVDLTCSPDAVVDVLRTLRDDEALPCEFFTCLSGIDRSEFGDEGGGVEVLVHLYSPQHVFHVNVHVPLDAERPTCPSLSSVFRGALWQERECHEMFGFEFEGHPGLTNLYLPEDFEGHPLRRSFKLPSRAVKEWPGAKDPEEAAAGGR